MYSKFLRKTMCIILISVVTMMGITAIIPNIVQADETNAPIITYRAHVQGQGYGWEKPGVVSSVSDIVATDPAEGTYAGTEGLYKRVEGIQIAVPEGVTLKYRAHVQGQGYGWMDWVTAGNTMPAGNPAEGTYVGTEGLYKRVEGIQIAVEGLDGYELWYRAHVQGSGYGWMNWVKAGDLSTVTSADPVEGTYAGTEGLAKRVEGIQIALVKVTPAGPQTVEEVVDSFNEWLANDSKLNGYEIGSYTKYAELSKFKDVIDKAQSDLAQAETIKEAETIVKDAKGNLLATAQDYAAENLKKLYDDGAHSGLILTEEQYNTVRNAIATSTDVADVIELYEDAVNGRLTEAEYNLMKAKTEAVEEVASYESTENPLEEGVTLDEAIQAEVAKVVSDAQEAINAAEDTDGVSSAVETAESAIDDLYELANYKAKWDQILVTNNDTYISAVEELTDAEEEVIAEAKAELEKIFSETQAANAETVVKADYEKSWLAGNAKMEKIDDLVTEYINAVKSVKQDYGPEYTDAETERLQNALTAAYETIESATTEGEVETALTTAKANIATVKQVCRSACNSRREINKYVATIADTTLQSTTAEESTEKYITAIQDTIDAEIAKIDTIETADELLAIRNDQKKNIYEALRVYLLELLGKYENLVAKVDTDKVLSKSAYEALETTKANLSKALDDSSDSSTYTSEDALKTLISNFTSQANLYNIEFARGRMTTKFNELAEVTALNKEILKDGKGGAYKTLTTISPILDKVSATMDSANSWADYETKEATLLSELRKALKTELITLINDVALVDKEASVKETARREINNATTLEEMINVYEAAVK